ncbi:MAG: ShlB/FhaC/HecB family hemolysin secretion/activation protein [Rhizomicrobium sp.]
MPAPRLRAVLAIGAIAMLSARNAEAQDGPAAAAAPPTAPVAPPAAVPTPPRLVDINEYQVEGNSLLDPVEIERTVYPFLGPQRPTGDAEKARAALEALYADKGYQAVVVQLPPQNVRDGVVHIRVIEAKIGAVTVSGQHYSREADIRRALPSARSGKVPNFKDLNKDLVALNGRSADVQVTPQLKPGSAADTIDVDLTVADSPPIHSSVELNNNYSQDTHPLRLEANFSFDNLWGIGHAFSAYYDYAPQHMDDAAVYVLSYSMPVPESDIRLSLTGLKSDSNVTTVGSTGVIGRGYSLTLAANAPLPSLGDYTQSLQAGFAFKHFTDVVSITGQSNDAPITYYPLSVTYNASWRGEQDLVNLSAAVNFSFRGLGSSSDAYDAKRYRALPNFVYLRASANLQHDFASGWQLYLESDGQFSNEPLISNEQFSAGGNGSVRGYLQAEALGDNGIHSAIEFRTPELAPLVDKDADLLNELRLFAFTDAARSWLLSPLPQQQDDFSLLGVGLGLRARIKFINVEGDWGHALKDSSATRSGEDRFYFRIYSQI